MQFGWLKENIKALPYWIWRHVQNRICAGHSLLLAGIKEITSSLSSPTHTQISSVRQALARRMSSGDLLNTLIPPSPSLPSQMQLLPTLNSEEKETEPSSGTIKRQRGVLFICKQGRWLIPFLLLAFSTQSFIYCSNREREMGWHQCWTPNTCRFSLSRSKYTLSLFHSADLSSVLSREQSPSNTPLSSVTVVRLLCASSQQTD